MATGTTGNDFIPGTSGTDVHFGLNGRDSLFGEGGDDLLFGEEDGDLLDGGTGNDQMQGGIGNDVLIGGTGNDTLNGGEGVDVCEGGAGDDTFVVDRAEDVIGEAPRQGTDLVIATINFTLGVNIENLQLNGSANLEGRGNANANRITGNSGHNVLEGNGGNDTVIGGNGNDSVNGGAGNDRLEGGSGGDMYRYQRGGGRDVIDDVSGADRVEFGPGITASMVSGRREGNNLVVTIAAGSGEQITILNHFNGRAIELFILSNGSTVDPLENVSARAVAPVGSASPLLRSQAQSLVQAMASFAAPAAGDGAAATALAPLQPQLAAASL